MMRVFRRSSLAAPFARALLVCTIALICGLPRALAEDAPKKTVKELCSDLASADPAVRKAAEDALVEDGSAGRNMVLRTWADACDPDVRSSALSVLQRIDTDELLHVMTSLDRGWPNGLMDDRSGVDEAAGRLRERALGAAELATLAVDPKRSILDREAAMILLDEADGLGVESCLSLLQDTTQRPPIRRRAAILLGRHRERIAVQELLSTVALTATELWRVAEGALIGLNRLAKKPLFEVSEGEVDGLSCIARRILVLAARDGLASRLESDEDPLGLGDVPEVDLPATLLPLTDEHIMEMARKDPGRATEDAQHRVLERRGTDGMEIRYLYVEAQGAARLRERIAGNAKHRFDYDAKTGVLRTWTIIMPDQQQLELRLDGGTVDSVADFSGRSVSLR